MKPPGSHLALAGQPAYKDGSGALGDQDTKEAQALLADAGWTVGGAVRRTEDTKAGSEAEKKASGEATDKASAKATDMASEKPSAKATDKASEKAAEKEEKGEKEEDDKASREEGTYIVGDDKPGDGPALHRGHRPGQGPRGRLRPQPAPRPPPPPRSRAGSARAASP